MIKPVLTLASALLLTSCAASFPPSGADSSINSADGSKNITTAPQLIGCVEMPPCAYVAYTWNSTRPNESQLNFIIDDLQSAANGYRSIASISLNIDNNMVEIKPYADGGSDANKYSSDAIYVKTHRSFTAPLTLLNSIEQSAHTEIKIVTDVGVIKTDFKESRAFLGLVNFNKQVTLQ